ATRQFAFTVPAVTPCGTRIDLIFNVTSSLGSTTIPFPLIIGTPSASFSENFDSVTPPAIPAGWTASVFSSGIGFVTAGSGADSQPNAAFTQSPTSVGGGSDLTSPPIPITAQAAQVSFRNQFDSEHGWDGGVLEISIGGGTFQDILAAGGTFLQNGYNGTLGADGVNNPLAGRSAWTGDSGGYLTTIARLPASAAGQNVQLRWRLGSDSSIAGTGWRIDTIQVSGSSTCAAGLLRRVKSDFDGDGRSDLSVFRPSEGNWYSFGTLEGIRAIRWGFSTDQLIPGDYDGDRKTDWAVYRPIAGSEPDFYVLNSIDFTFSFYNWGEPGDAPMPGDYDGDGKDEPAVFRASNSTWYVRQADGGIRTANWGVTGDIPLRGDFDGDRRSDFAIYRGGQWWVQYSNGSGFALFNWGFATDKPVPADYDGDRADDIAIYRPDEGRWYIRRSTNGQFDVVHWGIPGDVPVPGDYDGDGRYDTAVYRTGTWYLNQSTLGQVAAHWGVGADVPIPAKYLP
ncbi:MAG: hypothetical protein LC734_04875, partial [Acidobacteria bacterium]|nr:hypothetical protein [Acidobacteriota bacterium]